MEKIRANIKQTPFPEDTMKKIGEDMKETIFPEDTMKKIGEDIDVDVLSFDLWEDILFRLPCKSLYRAKCVSKTWMTIISNASGRRQPLTTLGVFFVGDWDDKWKYASLSEEEPQSGGLNLEYLPCYSAENFRIDSTCNGLLLCSNTPDKCLPRFMTYYVCNPLTKQWIELPRRRNFLSSAALAFDPSISSHFKVIVFDNIRDGKQEIDLFSSEAGQWVEYIARGEVPNFVFFILTSPAYLNGVLYRISDAKNLSCFEIDEKRFVSIKLPEITKSSVWKIIRLYLMVIDGYLCFIKAHKSHERTQLLEVWKLDNSTGKWVMKHEVVTEAITGKLPWCSKFRLLDYYQPEVVFLARIYYPEEEPTREGLEIFKHNLTNKWLEKACEHSRGDVYESFFFRRFLPFTPGPVKFFQWRQPLSETSP
ncbi:F-box protein At5g49610-like [Aristolochia californica]|uniref:F-box protein At5g49610-like n=1 Tax=Aristolochia californica TaxID=171875 RepID=UPI0035E3625B